ncbi:hypothetical protein [Adhaeribacter soli]|uniref:Toll/interleukin-1 receptor domain-containing protein n=1 Tax=Adhaeribacter soli TaxID=2607655 RepID=A0A5N1IMA9_9BACT|nr:hypothetical protein [Adhaeribacter soli]KAA9325047.1 hypothetical protein F0P94_19270 [Adhaeribacter soli]
MGIDSSKLLIIYDEDFFILAKELVESFTKEIPPHNWSINLLRHSINDAALEDYEVIILLFSPSVLKNPEFYKLVSFFGKYYLRYPYKLILSLVDSTGYPNSKANKFSLPNPIPIEGSPVKFTKGHFLVIIDQISRKIEEYIFDKYIQEQKVKEFKETIKQSVSDHLHPISTELTVREKTLEQSAKGWYRLGIWSLIVAVLIPLAITLVLFFKGVDLKNYGLIIFYGLKTIVLVLLAVSVSKYSKDLASKYMNESRRVADRRHAISFGEFALKASNEPVNRSELVEIFKDWNISGNSSFLPGSGEDHDPRLLDKIKEILLAARGKEKEKE